MDRDLPAIVNETSARFKPFRKSSSRECSIEKAEIAKSMFFFLSKRLIDKKFSLHVEKKKKKNYYINRVININS